MICGEQKGGFNMKFFCIADIHGFYDEMKAALDEAGFDPENENHTLISCGDVIDRGKRPNEVVKYLVNLPRKILIRGNHEDLLDDLIKSCGPMMHDMHNGTYDTLIQLASKHHKVNYGTNITKSYAQYIDFGELSGYAAKEKTYRAYKELLVDYFETEHYIFVHGWIPTITTTELVGGKIFHKEQYMSNWREATPKEWINARWTSGFSCTVQKVFEPNKTIVCGHWHAAAWHQHFEGAEPYADHSPYVSKDVIALDTCTALSKKVNVFVIED